MSEERDMTERPERFLRSLPAGGQEATPRYAVWEITLACDLGCKHCGSRAGNARSEELSTEQCFDVVRQMEEVGIKEVTLIGGEAYLREDWDQIAAEISRRGMGCSMTTGGRALTDEDRIPVERILDSTDRLKFAREGGGEPFFAELDRHFASVIASSRPRSGPEAERA